MVLVYAYVSSLDSRSLCTQAHTSQIKQQASPTYILSEKAHFKISTIIMICNVHLRSYYFATLPFSWKLNCQYMTNYVEIVLYA